MYLETTTNTTFPYLNSSISGQATTTAPERADAAASAGFGSNNGAVGLSAFSVGPSALLGVGIGLRGWFAMLGFVVVGALSVL